MQWSHSKWFSVLFSSLICLSFSFCKIGLLFGKKFIAIKFYKLCVYETLLYTEYFTDFKNEIQVSFHYSSEIEIISKPNLISHTNSCIQNVSQSKFIRRIFLNSVRLCNSVNVKSAHSKDLNLVSSRRFLFYRTVMSIVWYV